jgi:hypothetical protein
MSVVQDNGPGFHVSAAAAVDTDVEAHAGCNGHETMKIIQNTGSHIYVLA